MHPRKSRSTDAWTYCSPGTLGRLRHRLRRAQRHRLAVRFLATAALLVGIGTVAWNAKRSADSDYGGKSCTEVQMHMVRYTMNELEPTLRRAVTLHLAACPDCREKADAMQEPDSDIAVQNLINIPAERLMLHRWPAVANLK